MHMKRTFLILWTALWVALLPQEVFADTTLKELNPPKVFQVQSEYYQIYPHVSDGSSPGSLKFRVLAPHHAYDVEGVLELHKLLHEIEVIERIRRDKDGSGFFDGAADSVAGTGKGLLKLVTHPVESAKGVGKAAGKLGSKIGSVFRPTEKGESSSFSEQVYGKAEREIAKQFQVDVYTSNPHLRELISKMARARSAGEGAAMIATFFIPIGAIGNVVLTTSGTNKFADQIVNDMDRFDLFQANQEAFIQLGFGLYDSKNLLNSSFYTPREATYLRFYLEKLKGVKNFRQILKRATIVKSVSEAHKILYEAQMASDHVKADSPYLQLACYNEGIAVEEKDRMILITAYDLLDSTFLGGRVIERALETEQVWNKSAVEIWNGGKITEKFSEWAHSKRIKTRDWVLFEFTEKREEKQS